MTDIYIPKLTEKKAKIYKDIFPVIRRGKVLYTVREHDKRQVTFTWLEPIAKAPPLKEKTRLKTLHTYGFHGFFKPTWAEVISQTDEAILEDVIAFETIGPKTPEIINNNQKEFNAGYHVAETILYTKGEVVKSTGNENLTRWGYQDIESKLDQAFYLVEANCNEVMWIWQDYFDYPNLKYGERAVLNTWEETIGNHITVGYFGEHPVNVNFRWSRLDGKWIGFWHPCSRVIDYKLIENWIDMHFSRKAKDGCPAKCDAGSFHQAFIEIKNG